MAAALSGRSELQVGGPRTDSLEPVDRLVQEVMAEGAALGWSGVPTPEEATAAW